MVAKFKVKTVVKFDRKIITRNWKKINRNPIQQAGFIVMKNARQSIRQGKITKKGKKKPSTQGKPPKSWGSDKTGTGSKAPFKQIFSVPDFASTSVTIGMVGFSRDFVPGKHESGGTVRRRVFVPAGQRRTKKGRFGRKIRKPVVKTIRLKPRPFMDPALEKAIVSGKLPRMWLNSITKAGIVTLVK